MSSIAKVVVVTGVVW